VSTLREKLDNSHPALVVRYGNTAKKQFILGEGSTVLGRARGCDVELESPDISSVHCVITSGPEGLRIRDLNSRAGTRLNGDRVRGEYQLRDQDVIQLGPFSFDVVIPGPVLTRPAGPPESIAGYQKKLEKLERSRERLAEIALAIRRRLALEKAKQRTGDGEGPDPTQMKEVHRVLAERHEELEQRAAKLKETERELAARKAQLDKDTETFRAQVQRHEHRVAEFAAGQRSFDAERQAILSELTELQAHLDRREQEMIRRQADAEAELSEAYSELEHACGLNRQAAEISPPPLEEGEHRVNLRDRELGSFARHLRQLNLELHRREEELKDGEAQLRASWDRFQEIKRERETTPSVVAVREAQPDARQLGTLIDNLTKLYGEVRQRQDNELQALRKAVENLQAPGTREAPPALFGHAPAPVKRSARPTDRIPRELLDRIFNS
jgi:pSer/pThr/pTyr-binding forkhead associated (FHA) protein